MEFALLSLSLLQTHKRDSKLWVNLFFFNMFGNTSALVPCGQQKGGCGWTLEAVGPFLLSCQEHLSALPQFCLINQVCQTATFPAWEKRKIEKKENKRVFSGNAASLHNHHLSIRCLFCPQLVNLSERLSFSSQSGKSDLIQIAVLSAGAATNEALFFAKESIMKLCGGTIQVR